MPTYARRQSLPDGPWVLLSDAFSIEGGGSNEIAADPNMPEGPTRTLVYDLHFDADWLGLSSEEQRAALGIVEVAPADEVPPGHVSAAEPVLIEVGGLPKFYYERAEIPLAAAQSQALDQLAAQRWDATQFFTFEGVRTQADGAIAVLTGVLTLRSELGVPDEVEQKFKLANGEFRMWNRAQLVAFGAAISAYIQGCFDIEDAATDAVLAAETAADALAIPPATIWP